MEAIIKEAAAFAQKRGIAFMVQIQPSVVDLTTNFRRANHVVLSSYPQYNQSNLSLPIEKMCQENQIPHLNLYKLFMNNNPETLYFEYDDDHWNNAGQDLAAIHCAAYINKEFGKKMEENMASSQIPAN